MKPFIKENESKKILVSDNYNYFFDKQTGYFARWGRTENDDPQWSPYGPEILDIEVTTICDNGCPFCYKSNTINGKNMSFETFKQILDKMPRTLTQVAFGADASATSNPDLWKMMEYCRNNEHNKVIPNITVADIDNHTADLLVRNVGACAISRYSDKSICYRSVEALTKRGLKQTNIHIMVSEETYDQVIETIQDKANGDPRLKDLNAIVLLSLKKKGRGVGFTPLSQDKFNNLVSIAFDNNISLGFDSCSSHKFLEAIKDHPDRIRLTQSVEPCESSCFSSYVDVDGNFAPCSFSTPPRPEWNTALPVIECEDFVKDIWHNVAVKQFRENLMACKRACPLYEV